MGWGVAEHGDEFQRRPVTECSEGETAQGRAEREARRGGQGERGSRGSRRGSAGVEGGQETNR